MRGKKYSAEVKARALSELALGRRVGDVSQELGVPQQTLSDWAQELGGLDAIRVRRIEDLACSYLAESLLTLSRQSEFFRDENWVKSQRADGLAKLNQVLSDQTIRLLTAMERAQELNERRDRSLPERP